MRVGWRFASAGVALLALAACRGYVETGDLSALHARGQLRIIVPQLGEVDRLPRRGHPAVYERNLAAEFASSLGLEPVWVVVSQRDQLIPTLLEGRGDLIAANLTVTAERREHIAFSAPIDHVREQIVTRVEDSAVTGVEDLAGREVAARTSSSFWGTLDSLRAVVDGIGVVAAPEDLETDEILAAVAAGDYDVAVADDHVAREVLAYLPGLRVAFDVTEPRPVAWGVRPDADRLRAAADRFLESRQVTGRRPLRALGDLDDIRSRGVLRVLTRNSAGTYFVWRGQIVGFEYDLMRRFAERLGVQVEVIVPPTREALLTWLRQGRGDVVAAGLTVTEARDADRIAFTRPYNHVVETVVARPADTATLRAPADLAGRTVAVRRSSAYWETLTGLRDSGIDLRLEAAPEDLETEEIIDLVARGEYDLTLADSHILGIERTWRDDVRGVMTLGDSVAHAWAVRDTTPQLLAALNDLLADEYRGLFFNLTYNKYFVTPRRVLEHATERAVRTGAITPYDSIIQIAAEEHGFDWRLIAAQMFAESRFDAEARSFAGAVGLMQIMPSLGAAYEVDSLEDPVANTRTGVRYLRHLSDQIEAASEADRLWFALASYNAGYGHLSDARRLAVQLGRDPDRWFDEVEEVMPLLARAEYHRATRYGYCRCGEPVNYVRRVRETYRAYVGVAGER